MLVSSGMVLHTVPEGALAASIGIAGGLSVKAIRRGVIFVGVAILAGALFNGIMGQFLDFKKVILPFTSGVLLYVSLGHLMPAALKNKFGILGICFGAALIFLLLFGHAPH